MKYDYIIIGAGSAGCVLANRLSANPNNEVLLLEAGGKDSHPYIKMPGAYIKLFKTKIDWGFWTEPQEHINNKRIYLPRGKTLGGSSSTNAMAYVRGNKADYNEWASLGNEGWSYDDVLPYFKKSELHESHNEVDEGYHGFDGELNVIATPKFKTPYGKAFIDASVQSGFRENSDYNGQEQNGVGKFHFTIKNGKRHSAADAFLKPILNRPNLTVRTGATVNKIKLSGGKVTGVSIQKSKTSEDFIECKKEVILSAGAFNTPQILLRSGIGAKDELKKFNVKCLHELPGVGKNLQDHLIYHVGATSKKQQGLNHHGSLWNQAKGAVKFFTQSAGVFTVGPLEAVAFMNLDNPTDRTNFQFHFAPMQVGAKYETDLYDLATFPKQDGFTIIPTLLLPKSRGHVSLKSIDPTADPFIQPNFLSDEDDLTTLMKGGRKAIEVIHQSAFEPYRNEVNLPKDIHKDEVLKEHIMKSVETVYHPVGTCKMGNDEMAVVNEDLQVHGVEGLRVIDASIMPTIVAGNTNAPVYMIAEKGADAILAD